MIKGKKGAELSMNVIIVAIVALVVLLVIVVFFLGGISTIAGKIAEIFSGQTAGTDFAVFQSTCQSQCAIAQTLKDKQENSAFCTYKFNVDMDSNDKIEGSNEKDVTCNKGLPGSCPGVTCSGQGRIVA